MKCQKYTVSHDEISCTNPRIFDNLMYTYSKKRTKVYIEKPLSESKKPPDCENY